MTSVSCQRMFRARQAFGSVLAMTATCVVLVILLVCLEHANAALEVPTATYAMAVSQTKARYSFILPDYIAGSTITVKAHPSGITRTLPVHAPIGSLPVGVATVDLDDLDLSVPTTFTSTWAYREEQSPESEPTHPIMGYAVNAINASLPGCQVTEYGAKWSSVACWSLGRVPLETDVAALHSRVDLDISITVMGILYGYVIDGTFTNETAIACTVALCTVNVGTFSPDLYRFPETKDHWLMFNNVGKAQINMNVLGPEGMYPPFPMRGNIRPTTQFSTSTAWPVCISSYSTVVMASLSLLSGSIATCGLSGGFLAPEIRLDNFTYPGYIGYAAYTPMHHQTIPRIQIVSTSQATPVYTKVGELQMVNPGTGSTTPSLILIGASLEVGALSLFGINVELRTSLSAKGSRIDCLHDAFLDSTNVTAIRGHHIFTVDDETRLQNGCVFSFNEGDTAEYLSYVAFGGRFSVSGM